MDTEARLKEWIELYSIRLVRLACTFTRNQSDAEDRVQDAFIKAYRALHQLQSHEQPFPWLARIVINECKSSYRKRRLEVLTQSVPNYFVTSTEDMVIHRAEQDMVYNAVLRLPEKYRVPMVLFHFEEFPVSQIAEILKVNEGTVKTRLFRGRKRLAELVREVRADDYRSATADC